MMPGISKMAVAAVAAAALLLSAGTAFAASGGYVRYRISFTQNGVFQAGNQEGMSVSLIAPPTWTPLKQTSKRHRSFHQGSSRCRYSVTVTTRLAEITAETPLEHATAALPVPAPAYLIDQGTRNDTVAWRVTRLQTSDRRVRLSAMRVDRRLLGAGRSPWKEAWQETTVSAVSRAGDECHAGSYRAALGPQIGDALATAVTRAYSFAPRAR